jgi:hypothetical protein
MGNFFENFRFASEDIRSALVIGHPGHELLVHGWLEVTRPIVFVFTDGSGRSNQSRLDSTTKILNQTGAKPGSIYGRLTDAAGYAAILNHDFDLFVGLANELCGAFIVQGIDFVAGDALEGYNPMHDVCRLVINAAATVAGHMRGHGVANFEFPLIGEPGALHKSPPADGICRQLDDDAFARKMAAAKGYAELAGEVHATLDRTSIDALRVECLHPVDHGQGQYSCDHPPFYELHGEQQVAAGYYQQVLRYSEHISPLAEALERYVESRI